MSPQININFVALEYDISLEQTKGMLAAILLVRAALARKDLDADSGIKFLQVIARGMAEKDDALYQRLGRAIVYMADHESKAMMHDCGFKGPNL